MAELCLSCFLDTWKPNAYDRVHIVMSTDNEFCEGCMDCGPYVDHIDPSEKQACVTIGDFIDIVSCVWKTSRIGSSSQEGRGKKIACVECGNTFEHDDLAFVAETGECPYCHKRVSEIWVKE